MATYTSTQAGDWNNVATWGGGGWPNANGDVVNIGHIVNYNIGDSVITFNNITVNNGGRLEFPLSSNSTLNFDTTGVLTLNSGGGLGGVGGGIIDDLVHCYIKWPQGVADRNIFVINDGAIFDLKGDPVFYGSTKYATLESAWDANASLTLYVQGDLSSSWSANQYFWIHKNVLYSNFQTDGEIFQIQSVGAYDVGNDRTPITVTNKGNGATFADSAPLIMLSRNVDLCDPGASWSVYGFNAYTERISLENNQGVGNNNIDISDIMFRGWRSSLNNGYNYVSSNCIYVNNGIVVTGGTDNQIGGDIVSNYYVQDGGIRNTLTGKIVSNTLVMNSGQSNVINGDIISNQYGIRDGDSHRVVGDIISNYRGFTMTGGRGRGDHIIEGDLVFNDVAVGGPRVEVVGNFTSNNRAFKTTVGSVVRGDFTNNAIDFDDDNSKLLIAGNFSTGLNIVIADQDVKRSVVLEECDISGVRRSLRVYENSGDFLPLVSGDGNWQTPPSGASEIIQATPNSYCNTTWVNRMELSPIRLLRQYVYTGARVINVNIYPVGWSTDLDQDDIYIEALYYGGAGVTRTKAVTGAATFANDGWRNLSVTFTTGQAAIVYFNLILTRYEAGCYVLIDPEFSFI